MDANKAWDLWAYGPYTEEMDALNDNDYIGRLDAMEGAFKAGYEAALTANKWQIHTMIPLRPVAISMSKCVVLSILHTALPAHAG